MAIIQPPTQVAGTPGVLPNFKFMTTTDNLATVTTAGYLNQPQLEVTPLSNSDIIHCLYSVNQQTGAGTYAVFTVSIAGATGTITLAEWTGDSGVVLPTIAGRLAVYTNTNGTIGENAATAINGGNIQAGLSGTAGILASFPATASKGSLRLAAVANTGDTLTTISNAAMGQASVISIPDPGAATANFLLNSGAQTMAAAGSVALDKATATTTGGAATINKQAGVLTTESLTTASGSAYSITLTNSKISATSVILCQVQGGTNTVAGVTLVATPGSGSATILVQNSGVAAASLNGTVILSFVVF